MNQQKSGSAGTRSCPGGEMAAMAFGILNSPSTPAPEQGSTVPLKSAANNVFDSGATAPGAVAATITANDFLTLLVTELKNQDPTANTDPNQYVNQLVQVNSLEQLISINQTLTADSQGVPVNSVSSGGATIHGSGIVANQDQRSNLTADLMEAPATSAPIAGSVGSKPIASAVGGFSIPAPNSAAQRVGRALSETRPAS
jgi:flagellar basal-body rod modification protein FlgD